MQYNNHYVQDFEEDFEPTYHHQQGITTPVPTFYREVYTTNDQLGFQNPSQPQKVTFDFNSGNQIHLRHSPEREYQSEKRSRSRSKKKGMTSSSVPKKRKMWRPPSKKKNKVYKAYTKPAIPQPREFLQENRDWNADTRTAGYFDKTLRKQLISYPMKEGLVRDKEIVDEREKSERQTLSREGNRNRDSRGRQMTEPIKQVYEEGRKDYYTDLYEFTEKVAQTRTSPPRIAKESSPKGILKNVSPRVEELRKSAIRERTYSNPQKEITVEEVVEKITRSQEEKDLKGKPNPAFIRKAREILDAKRNQKFFVSMSVKRDKLFIPRVHRNPKLAHVQGRLMNKTASFRSKMRRLPADERLRRSKSPLDGVYNKQERIDEQQRIYMNEEAGYGNEDMYPTREDGRRSMRDIRSYSANQRGRQEYQEPVRNAYPDQYGQERYGGYGRSASQDGYYDGQYYDQRGQGGYYGQHPQQGFDQEDMQYNQQYGQGYDQGYGDREDELRRMQNREIAKRVEVDNVLDEYKNRLEERAQDPNMYFDRISRGLNNLKKDFDSVSQNLKDSSGYINKRSGGKASLVAHGAGKLIKLYSERLTEMMLDDLIIETIPILQEKEDREKKSVRSQKKKEMLQNCMEALKDLTFEQQKVHERAEEIYTLTTVTKNRMKTLEKDPLEGKRKVLKRKMEIGLPQIKVVQEYRDKFKELKKTNELFSDKTHIMMDIIVRDMMDDLTRETIGMVLEAQNEFVEKLFISEFDF